MDGGKRTYEQRLILEVLSATAQAFLVEVEKEFAFREVKIEPFTEVLACRLVELVFAVYPEVEEEIRVDFDRERAEAAGLGSGPDEHLPF